MPYILITLTLLLSDYTNLRKAGVAEFEAGHYAQAEALIRTSVESARANNDPYAEALGDSALGDTLHAQARFLEAAREYRTAISLLNQYPDSSHASAIVLRNLASDLTAQGEYREARTLLKEASQLISMYKVRDPALNAEIENSIGVIQFHEGSIDKAGGSFTHAAAIPSPGLWGILSNLGHVYQIRRQYAKAEEAYKESLQLGEVRLGPQHPSLSILHNSLGSLYMDMGRFKEAEIQFQHSFALLDHADLSFNEAAIMDTLYQLARVCVARNEEAGARPLLERAAAIARKHTNEGEMPETAAIFDLYSRVLKELSNASEAEHVQNEARRIRAAMALTVPIGNLQ
ncbi:MAG TPA: tetratricopeptide repeat protein [Terriglobia bacterium]|jgi:tetratricopeptide (TPR) repeat protein